MWTILNCIPMGTTAQAKLRRRITLRARVLSTWLRAILSPRQSHWINLTRAQVSPGSTRSRWRTEESRRINIGVWMGRITHLRIPKMVPFRPPSNSSSSIWNLGKIYLQKWLNIHRWLNFPAWPPSTTCNNKTSKGFWWMILIEPKWPLWLKLRNCFRKDLLLMEILSLRSMAFSRTKRRRWSKTTPCSRVIPAVLGRVRDFFRRRGRRQTISKEHTPSTATSTRLPPQINLRNSCSSRKQASHLKLSWDSTTSTLSKTWKRDSTSRLSGSICRIISHGWEAPQRTLPIVLKRQTAWASLPCSLRRTTSQPLVQIKPKERKMLLISWLTSLRCRGLSQVVWLNLRSSSKTSHRCRFFKCKTSNCMRRAQESNKWLFFKRTIPCNTKTIKTGCRRQVPISSRGRSSNHSWATRLSSQLGVSWLIEWITWQSIPMFNIRIDRPVSVVHFRS